MIKCPGHVPGVRVVNIPWGDAGSVESSRENGTVKCPGSGLTDLME